MINCKNSHGKPIYLEALFIFQPGTFQDTSLDMTLYCFRGGFQQDYGCRHHETGTVHRAIMLESVKPNFPFHHLLNEGICTINERNSSQKLPLLQSLHYFEFDQCIRKPISILP